MFSIANLSFDRMLPHVPVADIIRRLFSRHQNSLDVDEMPESWRRDVGILDGRDRRGPPEDEAYHTMRMVQTQRSL